MQASRFSLWKAKRKDQTMSRRYKWVAALALMLGAVCFYSTAIDTDFGTGQDLWASIIFDRGC